MTMNLKNSEEYMGKFGGKRQGGNYVIIISDTDI